MTASDDRVAEGLASLSSKSPALAEMIGQYGAYSPRATPEPDIFAALARSIIYQQLAGKAAASIHARFSALFPDRVAASALGDIGFEALRGAGLSTAKANAVIDLGAHVEAGKLEPERLLKLDDTALTQALVQVRGIGPWTAQMFMMFQLGRLDVWPTGDLGVRRGFGHLFCAGDTPTAKALDSMGDPFRPYRSMVAWYCWRAADAAKTKTP